MTTGEANNAAGPLELIATAASGTEAVVKRELAALGYTARTVTPGRLLFHGDVAAICRANLWLRAGERVLIQMGSFPATDFGVLFDGTAAIAWERWLPPNAEFPVAGRSHRSQLSSVPACQKIVKKAIVERLRKAHRTEESAGDGPAVRDRRSACATMSRRSRSTRRASACTSAAIAGWSAKRNCAKRSPPRWCSSAIGDQGACWPTHSAARARYRSKRH